MAFDSILDTIISERLSLRTLSLRSLSLRSLSLKSLSLRSLSLRRCATARGRDKGNTTGMEGKLAFVYQTICSTSRLLVKTGWDRHNTDVSHPVVGVD